MYNFVTKFYLTYENTGGLNVKIIVKEKKVAA